MHPRYCCHRDARTSRRIPFFISSEGTSSDAPQDNSEDRIDTTTESSAKPTPNVATPEKAASTTHPSWTATIQNAKRSISEARLRANRENAKKSTGPRTPEGKQRSSLNGVRHGILAQVIVLPKEDMAAYNQFTADYSAALNPVGTVEIQLAQACADIQFRLHRMSAAEHNLFALGHEENGDNWNTGESESHAALTFADTLRRSKDPIATITIYEQRLSRRLLQTLNQLRDMQAERRKLEQEQLDEMWAIVSLHPTELDTIEPAQLGFVCSKRDWRNYIKRRVLMSTAQKGIRQLPSAHQQSRSPPLGSLTRRAFLFEGPNSSASMQKAGSTQPGPPAH